ncbi:MAG: hypothetical protein U0610_03905 [bacterium]
MKSRFLLRSILASLALVVPACSGDDPGANFTIHDDLDDAIYVYQFDEGQMTIRYFPDEDRLEGVVASYTGLFDVGVIGRPIGSDSFQVLGATLDSNRDGDFLHETLIPVESDSSGAFQQNAHRLLLDIHVAVNGVALTFHDQGKLSGIEDVPPF